MKRNYSFFAGFTAFIFMLGAFAFSANAQIVGATYAAAKTSGQATLKVTYVETPGFVYRDAEGNLTGVCVAILEDFVEYVQVSQGIKLSLQFVGDGSSFSNMYNQAKNGRGGVIGIGNITITEARRNEVEFTPHFIENKAILITQKGRPTLGKMSDIGQTFNGMVAYTAKGTLNEARILEIKNSYWPSLSVQYAPSSPDVLNKVLADPRGFAYMDLVFYVDAIKTGKPIQRHAVGDEGSEVFGFVMPKGSDWAPIWEQFFTEGVGYRNSTQYKRILRDHLGPAAVRLIQSTN